MSDRLLITELKDGVLYAAAHEKATRHGVAHDVKQLLEQEYNPNADIARLRVEMNDDKVYYIPIVVMGEILTVLPKIEVKQTTFEDILEEMREVSLENRWRRASS